MKGENSERRIRVMDYTITLKAKAPRSEFESESKPRQGFMIGRYTTGACGMQEYKQALFNSYRIVQKALLKLMLEHL